MKMAKGVKTDIVFRRGTSITVDTSYYQPAESQRPAGPSEGVVHAIDEMIVPIRLYTGVYYVDGVAKCGQRQSV